MRFKSINPANGQQLQEYPAWDDARLEQALRTAADRVRAWQALPMAERCALLAAAAEVLRSDRDRLASLMTSEMGKLRKEALAEVEKCAWVCEFYAERASEFLADEIIASDASRSYVAYQPLGTVLAVMPWNFPLWQVFRFAAPALAAGNTALLKHASNVPGCAIALEGLFRDAGFPEGVFLTLMIGHDQVAGVIADPRVHAVTLTGSDSAGRRVAAAAGRHLKKTVLELGGSDPFVVLDDADLELAVKNAVAARFLNAGQSCIAAKRFIVTDPVADNFVARFKAAVGALRMGDPGDDSTTLAPMARWDLRDDLHRQVQDSIDGGAVAVIGCEIPAGPGAFYPPSILDRVQPGTRAWCEELFGPVATVIRVRDQDEAVRVANESPYGLGASVWTQDVRRGERVALRIQAGACFVNAMVKSDPRLPFGGVKASGYGRELSRQGIQEFCNAKTVWLR